MSRSILGDWRSLLAAPAGGDPEKALASRQIFLIVRTFLVSVVFLQLVLIVLHPEVTSRWLALLLGSLAASLVLLLLNRSGHVGVASHLLVVSLWLLISLFAWTHTGLGTRAAWGYFLVVFIAGMLLGKWQGVVTAAVCSASTLLIALAAPLRSSDPYRFWLINSLFLILVLLLQDLASRSIRESLAQARRELSERRKSEEALRSRNQFVSSLLRALPLAVFFKDKQGRYTGCNDVFSEIMGVTSEEISGKTVHELWPSQLAETYHRKDLELMHCRKHQEYEFQVRDRFGELRPVIFAKDVILDASGEVAGLVGAFLDISERKRAETALIESERRYRALFESASDAIFLNRGDEFIDCNARTLELFGCSREEFAASSPDRFSPERQPDGRNSREKAMERIRAALDGRPQRFDWVHRRCDGTTFPADVTLNRVELSTGVHTLAVVRDMSDRRLLEEQLLQAQKMEAVGILAGGVAHDFNNILSAIVGYTSLMQMKVKGDRKLEEYAELILASAERAASLTHSLLAFSRKQELELAAVDLNEAIRDFAKILARLIGEDVDFRLDLTGEELVAEVDLRQFEQVLMNLVTNSRDAMPRGGRLTIASARCVLDRAMGGIPVGAHALITVSDTGSGMDAGTQERIFDPFFTTKQVGQGTGLGLTIVFGIIKKHDGFIRIDSAPGKGTKVHLFLPLKPGPRKQRLPQLEKKKISGTETILLIEDDENVRRAIRCVLEEYGYTVLEAADGEEGIARFAVNTVGIDLVLCDLVMPRMNGRETIAGIRGRRPGEKAIFISGYTADMFNRDGLMDVDIPVLLKPIKPMDLLRKVRQVLDS